MIPSVVARQLGESLIDYVLATLDLDDPGFVTRFEAFLRGPDGLLRGPYLRLGLPFAVAPEDAEIPLRVRPPFRPYAHQVQAFRQLSTAPGNTPVNTLVTTGTGSGKTECFLFPVLDHCVRHREERGIKAILLYPMNALATDQARRLAELIHEHAQGIRAGLYVGGEGEHTRMGPDHLIDDRRRLRDDPPDILLTNYKMLDFLLQRPNDRGLWSHNGPRTLRFLVLDELHTFDGAQGSDVAALLRRLKARLRIPPGHLVCAGTSATIGSTEDPSTYQRLADFASTVFGEPFHRAHVVQELRVPREAFLAPAAGEVLPVLDDAARRALDVDAHPTPAAWLEAQQALWFGAPPADAFELGERLRAHPLLHELLAIVQRPRALSDVDAALARRYPAWAALEAPDRARLLDGFLALVSHARRRQGGRAMPLVTVQMQLWARELWRLLRRLPDPREPEPVTFGWFTDLPGAASPEGRHAPQARCTECGLVGLAAVQTDLDRERGVLTFDATVVGTTWLERHRTACFVWPRPLAASERPGELVHWLDAETAELRGEPPVDDQGRLRGWPVVLEQTVREAFGRKRFAMRCPRCGEQDALSIIGSRAASLTSVAVTQLFQTPFHGDDPKLLAFTDSVQDACHRAGFFGGRTYRIHLRTAMQTVVREAGTLRLSEAASRFEDRWRAALGDVDYVAQFLPPDLRELPEAKAFLDAGGKGRHPKLWRILHDRIGWEFVREYGLAAGIGRSLERTAASTATVDPERLGPAADRFARWLEEEGLLVGEAHPEHFLAGLLHRARHMGAVHHPFLDAYVAQDGNRWQLTREANPYLSPMGPRHKRIRFLSSKPRSQTFPCPFGQSAARGWFGDWMRRALDWHDPTPADLQRVIGRALDLLVEHRVLEARTAQGHSTWGLRPDALLLTTDLGALRHGTSGRVSHVSRARAEAADGRPSWAFRSSARLHREPPRPGFYARLYNGGSTRRVVAGEHTSLLPGPRRTALEQRFKEGPTPEHPHAENLLVCTPTLEMGVDIGDLSATLLCSVPPTPANYLQRVGRAGRRTGNALVFVMANSRGHDLYFHTDPLQMLDGVVEPPGVFLGATEMLKRQLTAWCLDAWAREDDGAAPIPGRVAPLLGAGRARFPGRFLEWLRPRREELLAGFLEVFGDAVAPDRRPELEAWIRSDAQLAAAVEAAFDAVAADVRRYAEEHRRVAKRLAEIQDDPTSVGDAARQIDELRRYQRVLRRLSDELQEKYPLNVLTDASVLPNYAFPESGVNLHSMVGRAADRTDEGARPARRYEQRAYVRPASAALRELAPFNTFYADGLRVQVRQLELGPRADRIRHWRFCPRCHHWEADVDPTAPSLHPACPRCEDPRWADRGQVRPMLPMTTVRSVSDIVRSTISDDSDEREQERYHVHQLFDVGVSGGAVVIPALGFGFEHLDRVTLTEVNLGLQSAVELAPKVGVGGEAASVLGFPTCRDCGTVADPRDPKEAAKAHTPFCPQRKGDTKPREPLWLFRQVSSEALRFLLPFSEMHVESRLRSFQAALAFGLRLRFRGRPMHLQVETMSEPRIDAPDRRLHFLVLFDTVPGGTGYLREFREPERVFAWLHDTLRGLRRCSCQQRGRDGCHLCLFGHQQQRWLPVLSSRAAQDLLGEVLAKKDEALRVPGLSSVRTHDTAESEAEERFVVLLEEHFGAVRQGNGRWELRLGGTLWEVRGQVDLGPELGVRSRADFVFTGLEGPGLDERVVVETDGFAYHALPEQPQGRIGEDLRKRTAIAGHAGWRVFSLTWADLTGAGVPPLPPPLAWGNKQSGMVLEKVLDRIPRSFASALGALPQMGALDLLRAYLEQPGPHWREAVTALLAAGLVGAARQEMLADDAGADLAAARLGNDPEPFPLPPVRFARMHPRARLNVVTRAGDLGLVVSMAPEAVARFDAEQVRVVLRLDDRHERRRDPEFQTSWQRFLNGWNLLQFLPWAEAVTSEGLEGASAVSDDADRGWVEALLAADDPEPAAAADADLESALAECSDEELERTIRELVRKGWPVPDPNPVQLPGGPAPEASWTERRVAVCHPDAGDEADWRIVREEGWTVLLLPVTLAELARALGRPAREALEAG